jgi:UDP-N-acetylglucosamine--N-acetylmuramyl-(pentapeptide) pyrophosphoryl-undecaprenol N-acetylglucosamine transferase
VKTAGGVEIITLPAVALQQGSRMAFLKGFWNSWRTSRKLFKARRPDAVLAMGGFTSAPPVLAARSLGAKTFLHESNTIPGRANRWLSRFVNKAFVGFPQAAPRLVTQSIVVTGTPVRSSFRAERGSPSRHDSGSQGTCAVPEAGAPTVLVMGGSQGASGINELLMAALPIIAERAPYWRWLHLTGPSDCEKVTASYARHNLQAEVHPFLADMSSAMANATAAVSRAGASSLAEIAAVRLPAVLIPFPTAADDHQKFNARAFEETGAARALEQKSASARSFFELLQPLVEHAEARRNMQLALEKWDAPEAAESIAASILATLAAGSEAPITRESASASQQRAKALSFGIWSAVLGAGSFFIA